MRDIAKFLYTHNPFYLISVGCVLYGLRLAFRDGTMNPTNAWLLAGSLASYTVLLSVAACFIVRWGRVWDDARTIALLVVLMFLAISSSFDEFCVLDHRQAARVLALGFVFSVVVSEAMIRSLQIAFPMIVRLPYYLLLAIFFFFPAILQENFWETIPLTMPWRVLLFPVVSSLCMLTLFPAVRRGDKLISSHVSPWVWPLYPWSIFFLLIIGICGRAYFLTLSFQTDLDLVSSFGTYYLVPLALAILLLLAEAAFTGTHPRLNTIVMQSPLGVVGLSLPIGKGAAFEQFLGEITSIVGSPLWLTILAVTLFYLWLWFRGWNQGFWGAIVSMLATCFIQPTTVSLTDIHTVSVLPMLGIAALLMFHGLQRKQSVRFLLGWFLLVVATTMLLRKSEYAELSTAIATHIALAGSFLIGWLFSDAFARLLRQLNPLAVVLFVMGAVFIGYSRSVPPTLVAGYCGGIGCIGLCIWLIKKKILWKLVAASGLLGVASVITMTGLSRMQFSISSQAIQVLLMGAGCFLIGSFISALKAGAWRHIRRWMFRQWKMLRQQNN